MVPANLNLAGLPGLPFLPGLAGLNEKEPGGMVMAKVPTWKLTSSVRGSIPSLPAPRVKGEVGRHGGLGIQEGHRAK